MIFVFVSGPHPVGLGTNFKHGEIIRSVKAMPYPLHHLSDPEVHANEERWRAHIPQSISKIQFCKIVQDIHYPGRQFWEPLLSARLGFSMYPVKEPFLLLAFLFSYLYRGNRIIMGPTLMWLLRTHLLYASHLRSIKAAQTWSTPSFLIFRELIAL